MDKITRVNVRFMAMFIQWMESAAEERAAVVGVIGHRGDRDGSVVWGDWNQMR